MTAMERPKAIEHRLPRCGAKRKQGDGTPCQKEAGWGTDHLGFGPCRVHGGSTASHRKAASQEMARAMARADLGEIDITALDAADYTVRREMAVAMFCRSMQAPHDVGSESWLFWFEQERTSRRDLRQTWKMATDAGVADRLARIAERQASTISLALDEALATLSLSTADRAKAVGQFADRLALLEHTEDIEGSAVIPER